MAPPALRPQDGPFFKQVKDLIVGQIKSGAWARGSRIPSENQLAEALGVSPLTTHRALRELSAEGYIVRVRGIGSFVADAKKRSALLEIRSISEEIAARGGRHDCEVHLLREEVAPAEVAAALELPQGSRIFHSLVVHRENGRPIQLADRYVNPLAAPAYLAQDFTRITPSQYLFQHCVLVEAEHVIEAVLPDPQAQRLLKIPEKEPCLVVHRRTWSAAGQISTTVRLVYPGSRYQIAGRFRPPGSAGSLVP
jgi:GntR family histidine utilization transcriptional repressor